MVLDGRPATPPPRIPQALTTADKVESCFHSICYMNSGMAVHSLAVPMFYSCGQIMVEVPRLLSAPLLKA